MPWRFTPIEWLEQKLRLASKYADHIVNWGYFPYMDPHRDEAVDGPSSRSDDTAAKARAAYEAYQVYYHRIKEQAAVKEVRRHVSDIRRIHSEIPSNCPAGCRQRCASSQPGEPWRRGRRKRSRVGGGLAHFSALTVCRQDQTLSENMGRSPSLHRPVNAYPDHAARPRMQPAVL